MRPLESIHFVEVLGNRKRSKEHCTYVRIREANRGFAVVNYMIRDIFRQFTALKYLFRRVYILKLLQQLELNNVTKNRPSRALFFHEVKEK
jgi:hypothetical protein